TVYSAIWRASATSFWVTIRGPIPREARYTEPAAIVLGLVPSLRPRSSPTNAPDACRSLRKYWRGSTPRFSSLSATTGFDSRWLTTIWRRAAGLADRKGTCDSVPSLSRLDLVTLWPRSAYAVRMLLALTWSTPAALHAERRA